VRLHVAVGAPLVPLQLPRKPKLAVWPAPMALFQVSLATVYGLAVWVVRPPQTWVIRWPFGKVRTTDQLVVAPVPVLVTRTSPWKPPGHSFTLV